MKKIIKKAFIVFTTLLVIVGCGFYVSKKSDKKISVNIKETNDIKDFISTISPIIDSFRETYEINSHIQASI